MWGGQVAVDEINFEWPTQEIADQWPTDVSLKSIQFSVGRQGILLSSVECFLSTDKTSPLFNTTGQGQFDANRPIRRVQAISGFVGIYRVTFLDRDTNEVDSYNP